MRLRKNMKRAAAAALALSMALSAAAPAALAKEYYIDDGDITVTVTEDGTYVRVGDAEGVKDDNVVIKGGSRESLRRIPARSSSSGPRTRKAGKPRKRTAQSLKKESRRRRTRRSPKGRPTPPPLRHRPGRSLSRRPQRTTMTS